jgi:ADP-heptose:LPS heptosyltransferase
MKLPAKDIKKIGILRALQMGDMLCCIPALRALRTAYPDAEIALFGLPWAEMLVSRFSKYIDSFYHFPGYPGLPEQPVNSPKIMEFIEKIRQEKFDLILQMQGNGTIVNSLCGLFGAPYTAGFCLAKNNPCPDLFLDYPEGIHESERHLRLMEHLGIDCETRNMEFPLTAADKAELRELKLPLIPGKYVCVHPGSRGAWRQWPPAYFAQLADYSYSQGFQVVITGTRDEIDITNSVKEQMHYPAINLAGKTSIGSLAALINDAYALICNCTGVSHLAAALQVRSIVISMDGEPERWAPQNKELHYTIDWTAEENFNKVLNHTSILLTSAKPASSGIYS